MPDKNAAAQLGRGLPAVRFRRAQLGRPPCNPVWKPWTQDEKALLGTLSDAEVARRTGHPVGPVRARRGKLGLGDPTRRKSVSESPAPAPTPTNIPQDPT